MHTWIVWMALPVTFWINGPDYVVARYGDVDLWKLAFEKVVYIDAIPMIPG